MRPVGNEKSVLLFFSRINVIGWFDAKNERAWAERHEITLAYEPPSPREPYGSLVWSDRDSSSHLRSTRNPPDAFPLKSLTDIFFGKREQVAGMLSR